MFLLVCIITFILCEEEYMKIFKICAVIALAPSLTLAACRGRTESGNEKITLRYETLSEGRQTAAIEEMLAHAAEVNNVNIEFEPVTGSWWDMIQKVVAQVAAGDAPDIIRLAESNLTLVAANDYVIDLGPRIAKLDPNEYYMYTFRPYAGKQIMVPVGIYSQALFYNRDMFAKAGIEEPRGYDNPWTFNEFRAAAKALTSGSGASKVYGFAIPFDPAKWSGFMWGNGADYHDANGMPSLNSPEFKEICQFFVDLVRADGSMASPANAQAISPWDLFASGKSAMVITGQWDIINVKAITDFKTGVAASPYNPGNRDKGAFAAEPIFLDGYCITSGAAYPDKAWDVIMSLVDDTSCEIMVKNGIFGWPVNRRWAEAHQDTLFTPPIDADQIEALMGLEWTRNWPALETWNETEMAITKYFQLMTLGEMSVNDACEALQRETLPLYQR